MQEFIEDNFYIDADGEYILNWTEDTPMTDVIKEALETEKQQIIKSWNNGYSIGCVVGSNDYTIEDEEKDNGNYYYNETYKNEG